MSEIPMDDELEEKVLILKRSMKRAILELADTQPRLVNGTGALLTEYIEQHDGPEHYMTPRVWFVIEQTNLTAIELKKRLSKRQLTFFDIREDLSNLAALCVYISEVDKPAYLELRARFSKLILILADLANYLENRTHVQCTNWSAVIEEFEDSDFSLDESPSMDERWARELLDNIEKSHLLGAGGFGSCTKILFRKHLPLTVKIVRRDRVRRRRHHAANDKAFASITRNRYLSRFVACIPTDDYHILIQEYIRGVDVQKLLKEHSALPVNLCRVIMAQLGCAVHYLQVKGFIHRDIKPSNIMIMLDCRIKLIDYDTVKLCTGKYEKGPSKSFIRKTFGEFNDGESAGTRMYLAPEVVQHRSYGRACDWWAMGVTLHYLSTGHPPFRNSASKVRELIAKATLASLPKLPDEDQHALSRSLMNRDIYKRITGARFHEYRNHPYFKTIDWATIENGKGPLENFEPLTRMFEEKSGGRTSPKKEFLTIKKEREKRVVDIEMARKQTVASVPLYTYISEAAREILERTYSNDDLISESDLSDPVDEYYEEVQKPQLKMDTYRFEKFLREPS